MKKILSTVLVAFITTTSIVHAQQLESSNDFMIGRITQIVEETQVADDVSKYFTQVVTVSLPDNQIVEVSVGSEFQPLTEQQLLKKGMQVVVQPQTFISESGDEVTEYVVTDVYRLPVFVWLLFGFIAIAVVVAKWRGVFSLIGMAVSFVILVQGIISPIIYGADPVIVSILGGSAIACVTVYLSHGWKRKSHISLLSIIITLLAAIVLAQISVQLGHMVGLASEEAYYLQFAGLPRINLQGLLLAGVILGALGVLDDIVVSQVSVVEQLVLVGKKLDFHQLYFRALEVGKDHVASLINTLVLAYVGANLPLFLLFYIDETTPLWVTMNSQIVAEELLRTFVGSMSLILAVPVATLLSAYVFTRWPLKLSQKQKKEILEHGHSH